MKSQKSSTVLTILFFLISITSIAQYCIPVVTGTDAKTGISNIKLDIIDNPSALTEGYVNYTAIPAASICLGLNSDLFITTDTNEIVEAWIDYNQDSIFSAGESIAGFFPVPNTTKKVSFIVPITAKQGLTRMRIVANKGALPNQCNPAQPNGDVEDYAVNITNCQPANFSFKPGCDPSNATTFYNTSPPNCDTTPTFLWNFGDTASGLADTSTQENPTHSYTSLGTYTVKLIVDWGGCTPTDSISYNIYSGSNPTKPTSSGGFGQNVGLTNVVFKGINHATPINEGYTNEKDSTGSTTAQLVKGEKSLLEINYFSDCFNNQVRMGIWIDWNNDGDLNDPEDSIMISYIFGGILQLEVTPPLNASVGNRTMRIAVTSNCIGSGVSTPCDSLLRGDVEDYSIEIKESKASHIQMNCYMPNSTDNLALRLAVSATANNVKVNQLDFSTIGSTNPTTDLSDAKVWFTGTDNQYTSPVQVGLTVPSPNGTFTFNVNQTLSIKDSTYYFWLTYSTTSGAVAGNIVDASCFNVQLDDAGNITNISPLDSTPAGYNIICNVIPEICGNGIDDDIDGLTDCYDPDCSGIAPCISDANQNFYGLPLYDQCLIPRENKPFEMKSLWELDLKANPWNFATDANMLYDMQSLVVGDIDGDNYPEVVAISGQNDSLYIIDGVTGNREISIDLPGKIVGRLPMTPAIADIDGDGLGEIFTSITPTNQDWPIACYENDGTLKWQNDSNLVSFFGGGGRALNLADFDGDGNTELYASLDVFDALTGAHYFKMLPNSNIGAVADILPDGSCPACNGLEIITTKNEIYSVDIAGRSVNYVRELNIPSQSTGGVSIADMNNDGQLEIISAYGNSATGNAELAIWNPLTGNIIAGPVVYVAGAGSYSSPTIVDIDDDGILEISVSGVNTLAMFDNNLNPLWSNVTLDGSGGTTAMAYDFEGDNLPEIVFRDEEILYVLDGITGNVLALDTCGSKTNFEHPTIVDVNGDGEANIVCACKTQGAIPPGGIGLTRKIKAYSSACNPWTATRKVMNQQNYNITNINDDLTIPSDQQNNALISKFNSYLMQAPLMDTSGQMIINIPPDVSTAILGISVRFDECFVSDTAIVPVTFCNNGCDSVLPYMKVSFYNNNPITGGTLIKTDSISSSLDQSECTTQYFEIPFTDSLNLYVVSNDDGLNPLSAPNIAFKECILDNNTDSIWIKMTFDSILISLTTSTDSICIGNNILLTATGGNTTTSYTWTPSTGVNDSTALATPTNTGFYFVNALDTMTGCISNDSIFIFVDTFPIVNLGNDTSLCPGDSIIFDASNDGLSYLWSTGAITNSISVNTSNIYWVQVSNVICSVYDSITIGAAISPTATISEDTSVCNGSQVQLVADGGTSYFWSPSTNLDNPTSQTPILTVNQTNSYQVIISDICGNKDSATVNITSNNCDIYIPNAFSPNNDGVSDILRIRGEGIDVFLFKIYDRWGNKVFESKSQSNAWDGTYNGQILKAGVFVYVIDITFLNELTISQKGNITLLN